MPGLGFWIEALCLLPTFTYDGKVGGGGGVCSVCLEEPKPGAQMPPCFHALRAVS